MISWFQLVRDSFDLQRLQKSSLNKDQYNGRSPRLVSEQDGISCPFTQHQVASLPRAGGFTSRIKQLWRRISEKRRRQQHRLLKRTQTQLRGTSSPFSYPPSPIPLPSSFPFLASLPPPVPPLLFFFTLFLLIPKALDPPFKVCASTSPVSRSSP